MVLRAKIVAAIGLALLLGFCKNEKSGKEGIGTKTETTSECQKLIDEIIAPAIVPENTVVFLLLSQLEYDIQPKDIQYELDEVIGDFASYRYRAIEKLKKYGISDIRTIAKNLVFRYTDGREEKLVFNTYEGVIAVAVFGKGKKPQIVYNPVQEDGILKAVYEYFEIEIK
jgi:hypothetical protein